MTLSKFVNWILTVVVAVALPRVAFSQTEIGQPASVLKKTKIDSSGTIVIRQDISRKLYKCNYQGISYWITLDAKRTIDFVLTNDSHFSTSEGLKIGSTYEDVLKFDDPTVTLAKNWASHVRLRSGWHAAFEPLDKKPNEDAISNSKIKFFFKRYDLR